MRKKRVRLNEKECEILGKEFAIMSDGRHRKHALSQSELEKLSQIKDKVSVDSSSSSRSNPYANDPDNRKVVLSAWDYDSGVMMDIDTYCEKYKLPRRHITSYKLVSHTGTPYYNIVFKEVSEQIEEDLTESFIEKCIMKHVAEKRPKPVAIKVVKGYRFDKVDRLAYADVHIGMNPNGKKNNSMYKTSWYAHDILKSADIMAQETLKRKTGGFLVVDDHGDLMDGWDGQTVRKGHELPQLYGNEEAFDIALDFKIRLAEAVIPFWEKIIFNNCCEDNHGGAFGYVVNKAFKKYIERAYPDKVIVYNRREFMEHYEIANKCFIISHGKDGENLKFGFKPILDKNAKEKIEEYIKHHELYKHSHIEFSKGDSHQCLLDMCSSDEFDYFNIPALSPSSNWVKSNFKKGRRGFLVENLDPDLDYKQIHPIFV